jgi:hypothetical protein
MDDRGRSGVGVRFDGVDLMPMMPGPLAAITYTAVKVVGYAGFAYWLNRRTGKDVPVWKFGAAKTAIGLAGGLLYFLLMMTVFGDAKLSDTQAYIGALPFRLLAWIAALALFYGFRDRAGFMKLALIAGVLWSYILDGVMAIFYHLPGMAMAVC